MSPAARIGVITQARTTSTRLPGKVLLEAAGRTMLDHHLDRLTAARLEVFVATTVNITDDPVIELARRRGVSTWRGSEHDVLARFAGCVREYGLDTVVRVTSDCPLIDGAVVREAVDYFLGLGDPWAYVSNGVRRTYPRGMDFEVFSAEALLRADAEATDPAWREHVTPWLYRDASGRTTIHDWTREPDASNYRVTLDTADDLRVIRRLIEDHSAHTLGVDRIVALLDAHPELVKLNRHVEQKKLGH